MRALLSDPATRSQPNATDRAASIDSQPRSPSVASGHSGPACSRTCRVTFSAEVAGSQRASAWVQAGSRAIGKRRPEASHAAEFEQVGDGVAAAQVQDHRRAAQPEPSGGRARQQQAENHEVEGRESKLNSTNQNDHYGKRNSRAHGRHQCLWLHFVGHLLRLFHRHALLWAFARNKNYLDKMGSLPLDGGEKNSRKKI